MLDALQLDCGRESARIVAFIRDTLKSARHERVVLGLSGGIDSALVAALAVEAVGAANVLALLLPYATSNPASEEDARRVIARLGIPWTKFEITPMVDALASAYPDMDARRKGNVMARCRMAAIYDQSVAFHGLVAGTSNRTETLLGYFTMHGDGAAAFKPIAHLFKVEVRALSRHIGVPEPIVSKAPSADLYAGQTDEGELGFTYDQADQVLYLATERGLSPAEIAAIGADHPAGQAAPFDRPVVDAILARMRATAFKREGPGELGRSVFPNAPFLL